MTAFISCRYVRFEGGKKSREEASRSRGESPAWNCRMTLDGTLFLPMDLSLSIFSIDTGIDFEFYEISKINLDFSEKKREENGKILG